MIILTKTERYHIDFNDNLKLVVEYVIFLRSLWDSDRIIREEEL